MASSEIEIDPSQVTPANSDVHNMFLRAPKPKSFVIDEQQHPDSVYARETVGSALALALSEAAACRPDDPIEFVAQRLMNYRRTVDYCRERDEEIEEIRQARIGQLQEEARQRAIAEEQRLQREREEQRRREELEQLRQSVPVETLALPSKRGETRNKTGATPLHAAVRSSCDVETLLRMLHDGHNFCARDAQGMNVRDAAQATKNDAVVKELDSLVIRWMREEKVEHLRWLLANDYGSSLPSLKKSFGPKLKGLPEASKLIVDSVSKWEARYRELWKLSAKGTREHLEQHCKQQQDQQQIEDVFSRTRESLSALHIALLCKNQDTARYLANEHPDLLRLADSFGRLPLHYAYGAGQNFVEILREAAAAKSVEQSDTALDAFGFAPSVYAKRYELLPEPPNYGSPEPLPGSTDDGNGAENGTSADGTPDARGEGEGGAEAGEVKDEKLTPINEDEGED
ncbi:hypothetical protein BOX15_Mlig028381g1 [Macrostomum lignano]|uniref:ANK_REP_REGION domain-containing protein n=2 Tax=Macrostomum lignano TaxID=282301 RepID=A0A1I8GYZ2_9PLAT|nr:hypothetical protein BOX15_Mlig028381g3 [Macrostomum lignano]PAA94180.1 hypothetical protein BOX15_Mlig028381g1 [Macrostomum lignano]